MQTDKSEVTAIIKCFMRPDKFEQCLRAAINAGIKKVIVGYDGPDEYWNEHEEITAFYSEIVDTDLHRYKFNIGLSYVRNRMVELTKTDFIMLLDDDNYIPSNTLEIISFLKNHRSLGACALGWIDMSGRTMIDAFDIELNDGYILRTLNNPKKVECYNNLAFIYPFDFIPNCALFKREVFDNIQWDEHFIISREHEDFYMSAKSNKTYAFSICPSLYAIHDFGGDTDFMGYRTGNEVKKAAEYFKQKWNIKGIIPHREISRYLESKIYADIVNQHNTDLRQRLKAGQIKRSDIII